LVRGQHGARGQDSVLTRHGRTQPNQGAFDRTCKTAERQVPAETDRDDTLAQAFRQASFRQAFRHSGWQRQSHTCREARRFEVAAREREFEVRDSCSEG
jgi:hypothetical protein